MAGTSGGTPAAHLLGGKMRKAREDSGIKYHDLAATLGVHSSLLGHWIAGRRVPSEKDLATFLGIVGVTGKGQDEFFDLARRAADPNWIAPGEDKALAALREYERIATTITEVNPMHVPGLLQTSDYARNIMLRAGADTGRAEARVTTRMGRRDVLERVNPPPAQFTTIIGEQALRFPACEPSTMLHQLRHLLIWAQRPNIIVQVLPIDTRWTPMHNGQFIVMKFAAGEPVVHVEHYRLAAMLTDAATVHAYDAAAEQLRELAMSPENTNELITELAEGMGEPG